MEDLTKYWPKVVIRAKAEEGHGPSRWLNPVATDGFWEARTAELEQLGTLIDLIWVYLGDLRSAALMTF